MEETTSTESAPVESTESTPTTEIDVQSYEGQDIPTTDDTTEVTTDINTNPQDVREDYGIPTNENGEFDFDNMTEEQLDKVINDLENMSDNTEQSQPEFELPDKFNNVDDLVKSYKMLEGKIGNFKGAPEAYNIEGMDMNDPLISGLADTARDLNMSNEALGAMMNKYNEVQNQMEEHDSRQEMAALGANAEARISNINNFIENSMNPHQAEVLRGMATSAESIGAIESLIQMARPSGPATNQQSQFSAPTDQDIQSMMYATDEFGNLKMETDHAYSKKVHDLMNNQWT